jgi:hypothetical protein
MKTWRHRIAVAFRLLGMAGAVIITGLGIYLPYKGLTDWALLPFLLALLSHMIGDMIAMLIEGVHRLKSSPAVPYCQPHVRPPYR